MPFQNDRIRYRQHWSNKGSRQYSVLKPKAHRSMQVIIVILYLNPRSSLLLWQKRFSLEKKESYVPIESILIAIQDQLLSKWRNGTLFMKVLVHGLALFGSQIFIWLPAESLNFDKWLLKKLTFSNESIIFDPMTLYRHRIFIKL